MSLVEIGLVVAFVLSAVISALLIEGLTRKSKPVRLFKPIETIGTSTGPLVPEAELREIRRRVGLDD